MALAGTTQRQCPHISCFSPHTTPTRHPTSGAAAGLLHQVSLPFPEPPHLRQEADALTVPWAPGHPRKSPLETPRPPRSTGRTVLPEKLPGQGKLRTSPRPPSPPEGRSPAHLSLLRPQQKRKALLRLTSPRLSADSPI